MSLGESAIWVNPILSYEFANSKIVQLREAARLKLSVPNTLISNDKSAITNFIKSNKSKKLKTIYKTFSVPYWAESNRSFCLHTLSISPTMLPDETILKLTPGIYQSAIPKNFEVRVTFFGDEHVAVKIHNSKEQDWRVLSGSSKLKISPFNLPHDIEKKCLQLMSRLKIVFGCFDFIVTPAGEFVFLEVNEMGQFIWIEELLPQIKIIDRFCNFLINLPSTQQINQKTKFLMSEIISSDSYIRTLEHDKEHFAAFQTAD